MKKYFKSCAIVGVICALFVGSTAAAEDAALLKDLTAVIALLGLPCGQAVSAKQLKENDHIATCKDANRFRVRQRRRR